MLPERTKNLEIQFLPEKQLLVLKFEFRQDCFYTGWRHSFYVYFIKVVSTRGLYALEHFPNQGFYYRKQNLFIFKNGLYYLEPRDLTSEVTSLYKKLGQLAALSRIRLDTHVLYRIDFKRTEEGFIRMVSSLCSEHEFDYVSYLNNMSSLNECVGKRYLTDEDRKELQAEFSWNKEIIKYSQNLKIFSGPYGILLARINNAWRVLSL